LSLEKKTRFIYTGCGAS